MRSETDSPMSSSVYSSQLYTSRSLAVGCSAASGQVAVAFPVHDVRGSEHRTMPAVGIDSLPIATGAVYGSTLDGPAGGWYVRVDRARLVNVPHQRSAAREFFVGFAGDVCGPLGRRGEFTQIRRCAKQPEGGRREGMSTGHACLDRVHYGARWRAGKKAYDRDSVQHQRARAHACPFHSARHALLVSSLRRRVLASELVESRSRPSAGVGTLRQRIRQPARPLVRRTDTVPASRHPRTSTSMDRRR
ncbi:uncharacterized protein B0H18DRAFT_1035195 [Fomitopsis serialis]|uniref:uncharacterized protein n=1 Tax=Fomitopsis serialis TaxID=139415 RepID=UPI002007EC08|nr:uncharacterized protein B0H18DRAFT_1035144 [Neoantrodia serialis]XP_047888164.1 uncharacterized protein B0H18DRAFT_1035195 [Neoantrodia serialis]KAH9917234.1 hypothetical protein B0H18DRAFT_1035144 [Neoantrodia serialis]KAH9917240.1 hypothetical protein B0H18DRAFT_1035195 [Neoantrodia serialis]